MLGITPQLGRAITELQPDEQRLCWDFIEKFHRNPKQPGISMERLHGNSGFWSGRVNQDLRAILGKVEDQWMILHIDHHEAAYGWAKRRKLATHQVTGALQLVELVEQAVISERPRHSEPSQRPLFAERSDEYLLSLGVPPEWLPVVREISSEDDLLDICSHLPAEVGEYLLELAEGKLVKPPPPVEPARTLEHPDTQRHFYLIKSDFELQQFLNAPLAQWRVFLHPDQRKLGYGSFSGPVKVSGGAGTGKTVVGMHRCKHLASQGKKVFLTTYGNSLAAYLKSTLDSLCSPEEMELITVTTVHKQALELCRRSNGRVQVLEENALKQRLKQAATELGSGYDSEFLWKEWDKVVSPQGITDWDTYRGARRAGRGRALNARERRDIWQVFERFLEGLRRDHAFDFAGICQLALEMLEQGRVRSPFDSVVVDELQDLKPAEIRLLAALAGSGGDRLMLLGDAGQRIYGGSLSLNSLGIQTRGRSHILRINYRTTEEIRSTADRLLGEEIDDLDGALENRKGTRSLFHGPRPRLQGFAASAEQQSALRQALSDALTGRNPDDIAIFTQTNQQVQSLRQQLREWNIPNGDLGRDSHGVQVGTLHRAKGLEFKVVMLVDVSERQIPLRSRLDAMDPADQDEFVADQRRLLYVGMTRARDELWVFWVGKPSRFLLPLLEASPS